MSSLVVHTYKYPMHITRWQTHGPSIWWVERVAIHSNAFHKEWTSLVAAALLIKRWCEDMKDGREMNCAQFIEISSTKKATLHRFTVFGRFNAEFCTYKARSTEILTKLPGVLELGPKHRSRCFPRTHLCKHLLLPQNHVKNDEEWILPRSISFFKHVLCLVNLPISEKNETNWAGTLELHVCACASQSSVFSVICPWIEQCSKHLSRPTVLLGF